MSYIYDRFIQPMTGIVRDEMIFKIPIIEMGDVLELLSDSSMKTKFLIQVPYGVNYKPILGINGGVGVTECGNFMIRSLIF